MSIVFHPSATRDYVLERDRESAKPSVFKLRALTKWRHDELVARASGLFLPLIDPATGAARPCPGIGWVLHGDAPTDSGAADGRAWFDSIGWSRLIPDQIAAGLAGWSGVLDESGAAIPFRAAPDGSPAPEIIDMIGRDHATATELARAVMQGGELTARDVKN